MSHDKVHSQDKSEDCDCWADQGYYHRDSYNTYCPGYDVYEVGHFYGFPLASVVDGVMTEGTTTGTDTGPHPMTPETDVPGEIPATGADGTIVALLTAEVMITIGVPTLRTGVVPEVAPIVRNATSLIARAIPLITVGNRRM